MKGKFKNFIDELNKKTHWKDEKEFVLDATFSSSAQILEKCYLFLENYDLLTIPPLLRQVQENIVIIFGLSTDTLDLIEFIENNDEKRIDAKKVFKKISKLPNVNKEEFDFFDTLLTEIKKILNTYTHTNIVNIMHYYLLEHHSYEAKEFNSFFVNMVISFLDIILTILINGNYKYNIKIPNKTNLSRGKKVLQSLKYADKCLPKEIRDFFKKSEILSKYFDEKENKFNESLKFLKDFENIK
jgi:hypothetical protein